MSAPTKTMYKDLTIMLWRYPLRISLFKWISRPKGLCSNPRALLTTSPQNSGCETPIPIKLSQAQPNLICFWKEKGYHFVVITDINTFALTKIAVSLSIQTNVDSFCPNMKYSLIKYTLNNYVWIFVRQGSNQSRNNPLNLLKLCSMATDYNMYNVWCIAVYKLL